MPAELVVRNAIAASPDWTATEDRFERVFPATNLIAGTPGRIARWREGEDRAGRLLVAVGFEPQEIERVAILASNIVAGELAIEVAQSLPFLLGGAGWVYPIPGTRWREGSAWIDLSAHPSGGPPWPVGALALRWATARGETIDDRPLEIGALWAGQGIRLPYGMQWGDESGRDMISIHAETSLGAPLSQALAERRVWQGVLPPRLSGAEIEALEGIYGALRGRARSALFIPDPAGLEVAQVRLDTDEWRRRSVAPGIWAAPELRLIEEAYGAPGV